MFSKIIPKFGTQHAFNFGLYLVDYIMYCQNDKQIEISKFDSRFSKFLQQHLGITWNVI